MKDILLIPSTFKVQIFIVTFNAFCATRYIFIYLASYRPPLAKLITCWYLQFKLLANYLASTLSNWLSLSIRPFSKSTSIPNGGLPSEARTDRDIFRTILPLFAASVNLIHQLFFHQTGQHSVTGKSGCGRRPHAL